MPLRTVANKTGSSLCMNVAMYSKGSLARHICYTFAESSDYVVAAEREKKEEKRRKDKKKKEEGSEERVEMRLGATICVLLLHAPASLIVPPVKNLEKLCYTRAHIEQRKCGDFWISEETHRDDRKKCKSRDD